MAMVVLSMDIRIKTAAVSVHVRTKTFFIKKTNFKI